MHYATTKTNTTELHRQDAGKVDGYCGKFAPDRVDPESASMGLASRIMRACRKCDEIAEDRRRAELSLADGLFVTELAMSSAPAAAEQSLFGAEELADLYVAPKHRQPRRPASPQDGGLFGDAELEEVEDRATLAHTDTDSPAGTVTTPEAEAGHGSDQPQEEATAEPDLFLSHVHADGTILRGSVKGDGVWEILNDLQCGWSWSRKVDFLFITHSRDDIADRWKIRRTAEALREAGWSVGVAVDNHTKRPVAEREADKYERAEERTEKFDEWAANASARAESAWKAGHRIADGIPFGQPILVGHHSERRARRDAERIDSAMRQSIDQTKKAARHAERAAAAGAFKAYRTDPARTLRRIETLETELRRVCAAFNAPWCSLAEAPTAQRRDDMTVRCDDLMETLEYWREVIADAEADGFKVWGPDDFTKGDFALYSGSWYQVGRKPGKKSVSVAWNLRLSPKMIMTLEDATGDDGKARTRPAHYSKITARLSAQDMAGFMERGRVPSEAEAHALAAGERWQPKAAAAAVEPREGGTTDVADQLRAMLAEGEQITKFPDRESDVTLACGRRYRVRMVRDKHARETRFDFLVRTADAGTLIGKEEEWAGVVRGHAAGAQEGQGAVCRHCDREWGVALGSPEQPTSCTPQTWAFCDRAALEPRVMTATAHADTDNDTRPAAEAQQQEAEAGEPTEGSGQGQAETTQQNEESGPTCQHCGRYINPEASTYAGECSPSHWLYCDRAPQGHDQPAKKPEAAHAVEITAANSGGFNARCSCNGLYSWALDRAKVEEDARDHLTENGHAAKNPEPTAAACPMCRSEQWNGTRCAHCHHNPTGAPVAKTEPREPEWQDGPAVVFIASQNTAPTLMRVLWRVTRAEAQAICSDDRTRGERSSLHWTERPGTEGEDWDFVTDDGRYAPLLAELAISPAHDWPESRAEAFPASCPHCFDQSHVPGTKCTACPTFNKPEPAPAGPTRAEIAELAEHRSTPSEDGGLFGDAELAAAQGDAERTARHDETTPAAPAEADPSEADARDRAADLADMVAEAESRARVQAEIDHEDAREIVPKLGWSDQIHAVMRAAAAGRLMLGADGEPRIVGANGGQGRKTRTDRLLMLVGSGMLNRAPRGNPLTPTADGARALYLANLHPDDVYATDREAYTARLRAARKPGVSGEEAKNAARRLPPLPHGVEEERRVKAMFADMRRFVERVEEIRRRIDEHAEQARRKEAERKRARSESKAPARESSRIRHVFCGPDPRIVAQWEAERAEAPRDGTRRDSSADPKPAPGPAHEAQLDADGQCLDRVPAGALPHSGAGHDALAGVHGDRLRMHPNAQLQCPLPTISSSAKPRPGCAASARPIGHPHAESSATRARPPREVDHGLHGRWPMRSTRPVTDFLSHRP